VRPAAPLREWRIVSGRTWQVVFAVFAASTQQLIIELLGGRYIAIDTEVLDKSPIPGRTHGAPHGWVLQQAFQALCQMD
jgi:hypothetical protein